MTNPNDKPPGTLFEDVPDNGAAILDALHAAITRYVVLPTPEAVGAVVLWTAATHAQPAWAHAARLVIRAPEKRCGKSRLLDVVEATCHRPQTCVIHLIRNTFRLTSRRYWDELKRDIRPIYTAFNATTARAAARR